MASIPMSIDTYQIWTKSTAAYPAERRLSYPIAKLNSEAGEPNEHLQKLIRKCTGRVDEEALLSPHDRIHLAEELGDVLWYVARAANELGYSMSDIIQMNVEKLEERRRQGTITTVNRKES